MEETLGEVLSGSNVRLGEGGLQSLLEISEKMRNGGKDRLLVITEFDMTLTKFTVDEKPGCCSYAIIDTSPLMPEEYGKEAGALKAKFLPMESDTSLSLETRKQSMDEWYAEAFRYHVKYGLDRKRVTEMVSQANMALRDGINDTFDILEKNEVPLLIFSAGVGDTLTEVIKQQAGIRRNMHFISNKLNFGENGIVTDIPEQIITSYTKGDPGAFASVAEEIRGRCNVVLLGESLGDPDMLNGVQGQENVIKIGFLNHNVDEMLSTYQSLYDIVLTGDGDMGVITKLLQSLLK